MMSDAPNLRTSPTLLGKLNRSNAAEAWDRFAVIYTPPIYDWCRRQGLQEADAMDVTQEVLCKVMRTMKRFHYDPLKGSFRSWLKTVTLNAVRDLQRKWGRGANGVGGADELDDLIPLDRYDVLNSLAKAIEEGQRRDMLDQAHQMVKERVQQRTWLIYERTALKGEKPAEVAAQLSIPISTVYLAKSKTLKRVRHQIRQLMGE